VLLLEACDQAVAGTMTAAIDSLFAKLELPSEDWLIVEPVAASLSPAARLVVGRTTYIDRLPRSWAPRDAREGERLEHRGFVAPFVQTRVTARVPGTAHTLARERFAESAAILDLAARPKHLGSEVVLLRRGRSGEFSFRRGGWILAGAGLVDERGRLAPPYRQLSLAASRDEDRRSDWQRRVLAAARWFSRSYRSAWAADRLVSAMVALECLFVAGMTEKGMKGGRIAERLTDRFQMRDKTQAEQLAWLRGLYQARNQAAHEGRDFVDDLEVDRLLDVTQFVLRVCAWHLVPSHRPRGRACRTFSEALRCIPTR
jgi:hypothetical protein